MTKEQIEIVIEIVEKDLRSAKFLLEKAINENEINSLIDYSKCQYIVETYPKLLDEIKKEVKGG